MPDLSLLKAKDWLFYLCAFSLVAAIVLGGGTRQGFVSDVLLQLLFLPLLLIVLWRYPKSENASQITGPLIFCGLIALVPVLQLIPLPPAIWTQLPNRQLEAQSLGLVGGELPWMPISVSPTATALGATALIVPVALFLGTALLTREDRRHLCFIALVVGLISVFLGLTQVAQGPDSPLRFFDFSNPNEAVGFFANRNHFSALLYALMLIGAAWAIDCALSFGALPPDQRLGTWPLITILASFTCLVVLIGAQAMARSRAGLGLAIIAMIGVVVLSFADRRRPAGISPMTLIVSSIALAVVFAMQFALYRIMERFATDPLQDARITFAHKTWEIGKSFIPFGSGVGTFPPVYAAFEQPKDLLENTFANRAHNDLLEMWLESGVLGVALVVVFTFWFVRRTALVWRQWPADIAPIDIDLQRTATLIIILLAIHSIVDYPLSTGAIGAIFAICSALLVTPPQRARKQSQDRRPRHAVANPTAALGIEPRAAVPQQPAEPIKNWGGDVEWPSAWKKTDDPKRRE